MILFVLACGNNSRNSHTTERTGPAAGKTGSTAGQPTATIQAIDADAPGKTASAAGQSVEECLNRYSFGSAVNIPATGGGGSAGSGGLEQRVLENELVVRAKLVDVEFKAVQNDAIKFELKGAPSVYDSYMYTLLGEVELRVHEYLKGEGPGTINAVVEGQLVFNSLDETDCAKRITEMEVGQLFDDADEGIALLESTSDPNLYHMGLAYENFKGMYGRHSTWLRHEDGSFYNRSSDRWISLAEVRQRISNVLEEYNRFDDEQWQSCVVGKYFSKGNDPWAYQGVAIPFHYYRDHHINFDGEHVPVPAGTMIWISPDGDYTDGSGRSLSLGISMSLVGADADLFKVTYHSEYEYTANEWVGTPGGKGFHLAIWHRPREGEIEKWQSTTSGHVITAADDLMEGEYSFNLHIEYVGVDFVDCGQSDDGPRQFKVNVGTD